MLGPSTMFGSCLNYVTLRLLGELDNTDALTKGRAWILSRGSASAIPQWGKIWLSVCHRTLNHKQNSMWNLCMLACVEINGAP